MQAPNCLEAPVLSPAALRGITSGGRAHVSDPLDVLEEILIARILGSEFDGFVGENLRTGEATRSSMYDPSRWGLF